MTKSTASPGRKALRFLGCLIKAPLGCLAFFVGAAVVFVIFFPPAIGSFAARELEKWFARTHHGAIEVNEAWLGSLYGPQKIERVVLRDPEQNEILHATVRAPSLSPVLFEGQARWGPVEIHVPSVRLVRDAAGVSNLARALDRRTERQRDAEALDRFDRLGGDLKTSLQAIDLRIRIDRLGWEDAHGRSARLGDVTCTAVIDLRIPQAHLSLTGEGVIADDDGDPLSFQVEVSELLTWGARGASPPWSFAFSAEGAPTAAVDVLLGLLDGLEPAFGPTIEELDLTLSGRGPQPRRLDSFALRSGVAEVELSGAWNGDGAVLVAEKGDEARARFAADSWWSREVVPRLVPRTGELDERSADGWAALSLEDFTVPLDGDPREVTGRGRLELGGKSYAVVLPARE